MLAELPRQLVEFMESHGVTPAQPPAGPLLTSRPRPPPRRPTADGRPCPVSGIGPDAAVTGEPPR